MNKTKKILLSMVMITSFSGAFDIGSITDPSGNIEDNLKDFDFSGGGIVSQFLTGSIGGSFNGLMGQLLNFSGIPGLEAISLSCGDPDFSIPELDICKMTDTLDSLIPSIPSLDFSIGGCSIGLGSDNLKTSCYKKKLKDKCIAMGGKQKVDLDDLMAGVGGNVALSKKILPAIGGKGIFGKDACADSPKRMKVFKEQSMKDTYGESGYTEKVLFDKDFGGDASYLNTRIASRSLTCVEAAISSNQSVDKCKLNRKDFGMDKTEAEIEDKIIDVPKTDLGSPPAAEDNAAIGSINDKVQKYWKLFYEKAQQYGVSDWKMLLAIGMHESHLNPTIDGPANTNGSRDYGLMQINSIHKKKINEYYGSFGGFWQALHIPGPSVDYGARVLGKCEKKFGPTPVAIDCYNKGSGNAHYPSTYVDKVKQQYSKISGRDFGVPNSPYREDVQISQRVAANAYLSFYATQSKYTMTHLGKDTIDLLPKKKKMQYIQMVNRYMAQKTLILASYKKASDIEKAVYHTSSYGDSASSGGFNGGGTSSSGGSSSGGSSFPSLPSLPGGITW